MWKCSIGNMLTAMFKYCNQDPHLKEILTGLSEATMSRECRNSYGDSQSVC